jgi:soluble epoxide hydrolase / lipid-phosphate phosphatase
MLSVSQYLVGAGPYTPVEALAVALPRLTYQVYFEKSTKEAVHELNTDIRRTLRGTLRSVDSPPPSSFLESKADFLGAWETQEVSLEWDALRSPY